MNALLTLIGIGVLLVIVDRAALWAEARGWIYWRRSGRRGSATGNVLLDIDTFFDPGARHAVEVREAEPTEEVSDDDIVLPPLNGVRRSR